MDSEQGKLFIGGLSWETTEEKLGEYFGHFGQVLQTLVVRDTNTGRPRGFGFVVFADPSILDGILQDKHSIDGRTVEVKRALSREEQHNSSRSGLRDGGRSSGRGGNFKTKKIFVGGLPPTLTEDGFRQYFESYGLVEDVVVMFDQNTQRPRGFGFITFDTEEAVDRVLHKSFHDLNGKTVEVKRALPKDANFGNGGHYGSGGSYQGYDFSNSGNGSYDGRLDGNGYIQPQTTGGGFAAYGSGYGAQGYGYGAIPNVVGYGGYGVGNYGIMGAGYSGPAGGYGNPNFLNACYGNDQQPGSQNPWVVQVQEFEFSAAAAAAYGNCGYYDNHSSYGNSEYTDTARGPDPSESKSHGTAQTTGSTGAQVGYSQQAQQQ